jgi:phospholipid-translocating ATPase
MAETLRDWVVQKMVIELLVLKCHRLVCLTPVSYFLDSVEPETSTEEVALDSSVSDNSGRIVVDNSLQRQLAESLDATDGLPALNKEQEFMVIMATCNTVVVAEPFDGNQDGNFTDSESLSERETQEMVYEAESPDEIALVNAAKAYGVTLKARTPDSLTVDVPGLTSVNYDILHVLAFTSERKRMSVILRDHVTQEIILYCKGADSSMYNILRPESFQPGAANGRRSPIQNRGTTQEALAEVTQRHMDGFARDGLRTLCIAKRVIDPNEYDKWLKKQEAAEQALINRQTLLEEAACAIEHDLELLGATGIEDRLQDGVPATMQALRDAGIVIWVLTGDKQETAINVAFSCQLFDAGMEIIKLNAVSKVPTVTTVNGSLCIRGSTVYYMSGCMFVYYGQ